MSEEYVVLVDEQDNEIGTMEKLEAHRQSALHRAISVFIFNSEKKLLMHRRANTKYHSPGLWTNTCCSHPRWQEDPSRAAVRRLLEEMGLKCPLEFVTQITYRVPLSDGMTEHELDHIFVGHSDDVPKINFDEVEEYKYMTLDEIRKEMHTQPHMFTEWFKILFEPVITEIKCKNYL